MIEEIVLNYLSTKLHIPCGLEVPEDPPDSFIVIEKTGSSLGEHLFSTMIAIQSYGSTLYNAAKLNESVKIAMLKMNQLDEICKISLNSDYNFTDTDTKQYRYQALFHIIHYNLFLLTEKYLITQNNLFLVTEKGKKIIAEISND